MVGNAGNKNPQPRPAPTDTWQALYRRIGATDPNEVLVPKTRKEAVAVMKYGLAMGGDLKAAEDIECREEGKPKEKIEIVDRTVTFEIENEEELVDRAPDVEEELELHNQEPPVIPPEVKADDE